MREKSNYYEKIADIDGYCYFVKSGDVFRGDVKYEIACLPHYHKNREFLFCVQGPQEVIIGGQKIVAETGDIIYVDDFEVHSYLNCKNTQAYMLVLSSCYFELFDKSFGSLRLPRLMRSEDKNQKIFEIVKEWKESLRKYNNADNYYNIFVNSNRLFLALIEKYELEKRDESLNKMHVVNILKYIDEHYSEDIGAESVARHFGFTKQYFAKVFNAHLGENFRSYLNNLRISKFLQLRNQKNKGKTVIEIAMGCGFNSEATFYRAYKNYIDNN